MARVRRLVAGVSVSTVIVFGAAVPASAAEPPGIFEGIASCMGGDSSAFGFWGSTKDRDFRSHIVKEFAEAEGVSPGFFHMSNARFC